MTGRVVNMIERSVRYSNVWQPGGWGGLPAERRVVTVCAAHVRSQRWREGVGQSHASGFL